MKNATQKTALSSATKGLIAGALGIGLIGGGATFALWSDDAAVAGGDIKAGNLNIDTVADTRSWFDVSDGSEESIDNPSTFLIVPGDTIQIRESVQLELAGDNLKAQLTVGGDGLEGELADEGLTATYTVKDSDGTVVVPEREVGSPGELGPYSSITGKYSGTYEVVVELNFPDKGDTQGQAGVNAEAAFGGLTFNLTQTR